MDSLRHELLSPGGLALLSSAAEAAFAEFAEALPPLDPASRSGGLPRLLDSREGELCENILEALGRPSCPAYALCARLGDALPGLVAASVSAFLHNSLFESVKRFLSTAKGSFGLAVSCSLDGDGVALAAFNQPMSIGFAPSRNLVVFGSEASALAVPLPGTQPSGEALESSEEFISHRFDIDNVDGEVVELRFVAQPAAEADEEDGAAGAEPWMPPGAAFPFLETHGCHLRIQARARAPGPARSPPLS